MCFRYHHVTSRLRCGNYKRKILRNENKTEQKKLKKDGKLKDVNVSPLQFVIEGKKMMQFVECIACKAGLTWVAQVIKRAHGGSGGGPWVRSPPTAVPGISCHRFFPDFKKYLRGVSTYMRSRTWVMLNGP